MRNFFRWLFGRSVEEQLLRQVILNQSILAGNQAALGEQMNKIAVLLERVLPPRQAAVLLIIPGPIEDQ